jgi:sulfur-carrier protein
MQIKLFASLRQPGIGGQVELPVASTTVRHALDELFARVPALRPHIMHPDGHALLPFVNVMLRGRLIRDLQGLDTPVTDDDTLAIFPPVAGG